MKVEINQDIIITHQKPNNQANQDGNVKQESYFDDIFGDGDMFTESYDFYF